MEQQQIYGGWHQGWRAPVTTEIQNTYSSKEAVLTSSPSMLESKSVQGNSSQRKAPRAKAIDNNSNSNKSDGKVCETLRSENSINNITSCNEDYEGGKGSGVSREMSDGLQIPFARHSIQVKTLKSSPVTPKESTAAEVMLSLLADPTTPSRNSVQQSSSVNQKSPERFSSTLYSRAVKMNLSTSPKRKFDESGFPISPRADLSHNLSDSNIVSSAVPRQKEPMSSDWPCKRRRSETFPAPPILAKSNHAKYLEIPPALSLNDLPFVRQPLFKSGEGEEYFGTFGVHAFSQRDNAKSGCADVLVPSSNQASDNHQAKNYYNFSRERSHTLSPEKMIQNSPPTRGIISGAQLVSSRERIHSQIESVTMQSEKDRESHQKRRFNTVSGYRGVIQIGSKFRVQIGPKGVKQSIGTYSTAREAAYAYDKAALNYFGNGAILNFPGKITASASSQVDSPGNIPKMRFQAISGEFVRAEHVKKSNGWGIESSRYVSGNLTKVTHILNGTDGNSHHQSKKESQQNSSSLRVLRSGESPYLVPDPVPFALRPFATATGYRGVVHKRGKFQAQIGSRKTREYLGTYATAEEAACVYDREAIRRFGNRAAVNFRALVK